MRYITPIINLLMKKIFYFVLPALILLSCVEQYSVPIRAEQAQLVVDGGISTTAPPYKIKLTYSGVFDYANTIPADLVESKAIVTATDDKGQSTTFKYLGLGNYQSQNMQFRGQVGRTYSVKIVLPDGRTFQSKPETVPNVVPIKKVYGEFVPNLFVRTENKQISFGSNYSITEKYPAEPDGPTGYRIYLDTDDPAGQTNYYRWVGTSVTRRQTTGYDCGMFTICDNTCFLPADHLDLNILSDQLIDGNSLKKKPLFLVPVFATGILYIEVNQLNYTREAFLFWKSYQEQLTRTGSILDPLPAPIQGNVYNVANPNELALGYFSATASYKKRLNIVVVEPSELPRGLFNLRRGGCARDVYPTKNPYPTGDWPTSPTWVTDDPNK
jgi:hypothetical protein